MPTFGQRQIVVAAKLAVRHGSWMRGSGMGLAWSFGMYCAWLQRLLSKKCKWAARAGCLAEPGQMVRTLCLGRSIHCVSTAGTQHTAMTAMTYEACKV